MSAKWPSSIATDADLYVAVNSLQTTLATALGTGDVSVVLASATGFPTAGGVTVGNEVIFYTGVSGATLTGCTRGADGTTAAAHSVGVPVGAAIIAFHHNGLMAEIEAIESYLDTVLGKGTAVTATEFSYLHGVTSAIQTQMNLKAALAGPTFTGTVTVPTPFTVGAVSVTATGTEMNYLVGVSSAIQTQLGLKAPLAGPTFTGTVTIPTPFTLGAVSVTATGTELNFVVGVTSAIQTQLGLKAPLASPTFTGTVTAATMDVQTFFKGKGQGDNTAVAAGYLGEVISSSVSATNLAATNTFGNITSITLTPGNWRLSANMYIQDNSSSFTTSAVCQGAISVNTGNTTTDHVDGKNVMHYGPQVASAAAQMPVNVPTYYLLLSAGTTTVFLKAKATYTGTAPQALGTLWAERIS